MTTSRTASELICCQSTDFGSLPPEVNSGRIYAGPGSTPMAAAAAAWDRLAEQQGELLRTCRTGIAGLPGGWEGPAAIAMRQAAAPYLMWLQSTAAQAAQTATQARAAVNAYESAYAAVVHPRAIEANRTLRGSLAAMNWLGHTSAAIAAADAEYDEMWGQDADAMYAYAGASAAAAAVRPFAAPPYNAIAVAQASSVASEVIVRGNSVIAAIPEVLHALRASPLTTLEWALAPVTAALSKLASLSAPSDLAINQLNLLNRGAALRTLLPAKNRPAGAGVRVRPGCGMSVGALSVPPAWPAANPPATSAAPMAIRLCGPHAVRAGQSGVT
ncbi:PPE family protein [Mycobacterium kubicae]|uniref:PPE family protein n=1 Tax=Mycobacterium kubicae TaxID=120959 RepID=UPI00163EBFEE|nr:PPE family protein [Mycobacterium kubicae]